MNSRYDPCAGRNLPPAIGRLICCGRSLPQKCGATFRTSLLCEGKGPALGMSGFHVLPLRIGALSVKSSNCRPNFALIITEQKLCRKGVMCNPGDVCCARNMQFS